MNIYISPSAYPIPQSCRRRTPTLQTPPSPYSLAQEAEFCLSAPSCPPEKTCKDDNTHTIATKAQRTHHT